MPKFSFPIHAHTRGEIYISFSFTFTFSFSLGVVLGVVFLMPLGLFFSTFRGCFRGCFFSSSGVVFSIVSGLFFCAFLFPFGAPPITPLSAPLHPFSYRALLAFNCGSIADHIALDTSSSPKSGTVPSKP